MCDYIEVVHILRDDGVSEADQQAALTELVERFRPMLYSCAIGFLGDQMQADDAVQETFITAWQNITKLREPARLPGWLRRIVLWQCHYYKRPTTPTVPLETLIERLGDNTDLAAEMEGEELIAQVRQVLWALPRPHREILILHYLEEYSQSEIATFLELSEGAVRKRLHDARHKTCGLYQRWLADVSLSAQLTPTTSSPWRKMMTATKRDTSGRTPQDKIDAIHRPKWCVTSEKGRLYWDLIGAAIRDDAETIRAHLRQAPDCARLEFWYTPPIHFAVREGNLEATRLLWEAYAYEKVTDLIAMADDRNHTDVAAYLRGAIGAAATNSDLRLHEAVEAGDREEIERLLQEVPGIGEKRDPKGRTALHIAVIANNHDTVRALLAGDVEIDAIDHGGFRAAHYTFWTNHYWKLAQGDVNLLQILLDGGAADSPTLAAARGDLVAVRAFVEADAAAANEGETLQKRPLSAAMEQNHREIVRYLLDHGADPSLPESRSCPHGSALMGASVGDNLEMARWLLEAGADPNGSIDSSGTPANRAQSNAMRGLLYGYGGRAAAAWVYAQQGDLETLAAILRYCDDPFSNEDKEFTLTPYTAVVSGYKRRLEKEENTDAHTAMLTMFLQRQHPMPQVLTECKSYLYHAPHMTHQLLEHGLDPNLPDWQRRTPLHDLCAGIRHVEETAALVQMFLEHGANIDAIDEEDRSTPLGIAAREGNMALVDLLLENGANPNVSGANWATPLAWAERRGHEEISALLRQRGAA